MTSSLELTAAHYQASEAQRESAAAQAAQLRAENHQLRAETAAKARSQPRLALRSRIS